MKYHKGLVTLIILMVSISSVPLGAQLQEATKVPWPGFHVLQGRWQDQNSLGVINIKKVNTTGGIEMQYIDLEPVHVTQAQAARDGKSTKILIVLRYSDLLCCTYDLTYDPQSDQLKGISWRKGNSKTTEVVFDRLGPK